MTGGSGDGAQPAAADRDLRRRTKLALLVALVLTNINGAALVLILAAWVLPSDALVADQHITLGRNLGVFSGYLVGAVALGVMWGFRRMRIPAPPSTADPAALARHRRRVRRVILSGPMRLTVVQSVPWAVAVVVFAGLNLQYSARLATTVAATVAIGGVATVAVSYRLTERVLRSEAARVLAEEPPPGLKLPAVALRQLSAWFTGTAVPLLGLCLAAAASLAYADYYTLHRLAAVVLVLGAITFGVGFLTILLSSMSLAAPVLAVRRALSKVARGDYDVEVPVFDTTELGLLQAGFNDMVGGLRERERVRDLFDRHVGRDVARTALADELARDGSSAVVLGGELREAAVLFVDIVGSTELAATRPPHEVVELLNRFFTIVVEVVEKHDGWINKFQGDAALAVFGAPIQLPDPAGSALRAGRELGRRLGEDVPEIGAGIGISAGTVVAGNMGAPSRYEYTVIGDPVNEAARLSEVAKDPGIGGVVASGSAIERADRSETAHWRVDGSRTLRGRGAATELAVPVGLSP
ncbi:MAG TPA: adenylate/guanylate cyclase domain-containing protein [Pseudonocardia sp.]|nr:adenylate/guanylate cyclase domain-containing protein [Pseudonocardia sp.]